MEFWAALEVWVRLGVPHFKGIQEKRRDPEPLKSTSSPQAILLTPALSCHGEPGCDMYPPQTKPWDILPFATANSQAGGLCCSRSHTACQPSLVRDRGGQRDVPCGMRTREWHLHHSALSPRGAEVAWCEPGSLWAVGQAPRHPAQHIPHQSIAFVRANLAQSRAEREYGVSGACFSGLMGSAQAQPPPAWGSLVSELGQPGQEISQPSAELAAAASPNRGGSKGVFLQLLKG